MSRWHQLTGRNLPVAGGGGGGACEENGKYIGVLIFLTIPVLNIEDAGKVLVMY